MIFKSQYCFANISATKAQIFMKFEAYIHKVVKNHQIIFCKDQCTHAQTRDVNLPARVLSRWNARAHTYASCTRICARIFMKNHLMILYYLMNISLKFHKDLSFRCGDICKTILTFKNHQFWNILDMGKCCQDKCCLDKCHRDSWDLLTMVTESWLWRLI